jgi:hypothetical protein
MASPFSLSHREEVSVPDGNEPVGGVVIVV